MKTVWTRCVKGIRGDYGDEKGVVFRMEGKETCRWEICDFGTKMGSNMGYSALTSVLCQVMMIGWIGERVIDILVKKRIDAKKIKKLKFGKLCPK